MHTPAPPSPLRTRSRVAGAGVVAAAILLLQSACMAPSGAPPALGPDDLARQFCVPVPAEARVAAAQPPAIEQRVAVSAAPPPPHAPSRVVTARRGEVVHLVVQGPVDGAAGIHGISDILAVRSGEAVRIAFRAAYTGRFPLHFHGVDGSHFELLALEVHE